MWTFLDLILLTSFNLSLISLGLICHTVLKKVKVTFLPMTTPNISSLWVVGFGVSTLLFLLAGLIQLQALASWTLLIIGGVSLVFYLPVLKQTSYSVFPWKRFGVGFLLTLAVCYFLLLHYQHLSLTQPIHGVSGMGNWAYKAKLIYHAQGMNADYFTTHTHHYGKFSYPPGHPLLSSLLCSISGDFNEMLLKKQSILMLLGLYCTLTYQFFKNWGWFGFVPALGLSGLFLGNGAWTVTYWFYSEPLLWLCCVGSVLSLQQKHLHIAILCAGCAAWVKNEGALFFVCLMTTVFILHYQKWNSILTLSALAALPVLGWKMAVSHYGISDSDFSFQQFSYQNVDVAFKEVTRIVIHEWFQYSGMFAILPIAILWLYLQKNWTAIFICLIATFIGLVYIYSMGWSAVGDIHWHLSSAIRYMMLPSFIIAATLASVRLNSKTPDETTA